MFRNFILITSTGATFALFFVLLVVAAPLQAQEVRTLPGYSSLTVGAEFEDYLNKNPVILRALERDPKFAKKLLSDREAQRRILQGTASLSDIKRELSSSKKQIKHAEQSNKNSHFNSPFSGQRPSDAKVQQNLSKAVSILDKGADASGKELAQVAAKREQALRDVLEKLEDEDQLELLEKLLGDGELQQKIIDDEVTVYAALKKLGAPEDMLVNLKDNMNRDTETVPCRLMAVIT